MEYCFGPSKIFYITCFLFLSTCTHFQKYIQWNTLQPNLILCVIPSPLSQFTRLGKHGLSQTCHLIGRKVSCVYRLYFANRNDKLQEKEEEEFPLTKR